MARTSIFWLGLLGLGIELVLGLDGPNSLQANECQPPTPCPCAADGTCHPKRDTWGSYKTHWRPWPGDKVGLTPTKTEETESDIKQQLPTYQPPRPEQEELRGPAKKLPSAEAAKPATTDAPPQAVPAAEAAEPAGQEFELPGLPGIPDFDPQGSLPPGRLQVLPQIEDGPPSLPENLKASLAVTPNYQDTVVQSKNAPTVVANRSRIAAAPTEASAGNLPRRGGQIVQATAEVQQVSDIQLTNPAAKNIYKPTDDELHQAIYFEAGDE